MTDAAAERIRSDWACVNADSDRFTTLFYDALFTLDPAMPRHFGGLDMDAQKKKLSAALTALVGMLDHQDRMVASAVPLGQRHAHLGLSLRDYEVAGDALFAALAGFLGDAFDRDSRDAWREWYRLVSVVMSRAGGRPAPRG